MPPTQAQMLATEKADLYKRVFIAALTGMADANDYEHEELVARAESIAALAVKNARYWKANIP